MKEVDFYTDRLRAFIEFVEQYNCKDKNNYCGTNFGDGLQQWDPETTPKLIEQELKGLENISEEEFNKTDKWRKNGPVFKELSTKEMLNDPWFNKEIDNFFGLEKNQILPQNCAFCSKTIDPLQYVWVDKEYFCDSSCMLNRKPKKDDNGSVPTSNDNKEKKSDYQTWTQEQLISEINHLKAEIKELKNDQTLTSSERQGRLQKSQQKLEQLKGLVEGDKLNTQNSKQNKSNNNFPTGWVVGGGIALAVIGLTILFIIKDKRRKKIFR